MFLLLAAGCGEAACRLHELAPNQFVWPAPDALRYDADSPTQYRARLPWRLRPGVAGTDGFDGAEGFATTGPLLISRDFARVYLAGEKPRFALYDGVSGAPVEVEPMASAPDGLYGALPTAPLQPDHSYWLSVAADKPTGCGDDAPIVLESPVRPRLPAHRLKFARSADRRVLIPFHTQDPRRNLREAAVVLERDVKPTLTALTRYAVTDSGGRFNGRLRDRLPPLTRGLAYGEKPHMPVDHLAEVVLGELESVDFRRNGRFPPKVASPSTRRSLPFLLTVPKPVTDGTRPFRLVLFSHPLRACKEAALGLADTLAAAGFAVAAIDHVGHGARRMDMPGNYKCGDDIPWNFFAGGDAERLRANILTSALDLYQLKMALQHAEDESLDFDADGRADIDTRRVAVVGMSLGSIIAAPFLALAGDADVAVLNTPLGTSIELADQQAPGTSGYALALPGIQPALSLALVQTVLEPGEPLSYAAELRAHPRDLLLQTAVDDGVVPNASTAKLARALGATAVEPAWVDMGLPTARAPFRGKPTRAVYQLLYANHSFLLLPHDVALLDPARAQVAHFLRSHYDEGRGEVIRIKRR